MAAQFTTRMQVMVEPATDESLQRIADQHGFSKALLVRAVLTDWLDGAGEAEARGEEPALDLVVALLDREHPPGRVTPDQLLQRQS